MESIAVSEQFENEFRTSHLKILSSSYGPSLLISPVDCLIAIGSNLGDRLAHLRAGIAAIDALHGVHVTDVSSLYETAPVGGPEQQGPFLNAALRAETTAMPQSYSPNCTRSKRNVTACDAYVGDREL